MTVLIHIPPLKPNAIGVATGGINGHARSKKATTDAYMTVLSQSPKFKT